MSKLLKQREAWVAATVVASLLLPCVLWYEKTGDLAIYLSPGTPAGQLPYVFSKLLGMLALVCISWQVVIALASKLSLLPPKWLRFYHRLFGVLVLGLVLAHFVLFFAAASLRQGAPAWALLLPDFRDFWHTHLTFGLFALWALCLVTAIGIARLFFRSPWFHYLHRLYWLVLGFGYFHALAVGSEFQSQQGLIFYAALAVLLLAVAIWVYLRSSRRLQLARRAVSQ